MDYKCKNIKEADEKMLELGISYDDRIKVKGGYIYFEEAPNISQVAEYDIKEKILIIY